MTATTFDLARSHIFVAVVASCAVSTAAYAEAGTRFDRFKEASQHRTSGTRSRSTTSDSADILLIPADAPGDAPRAVQRRTTDREIAIAELRDWKNFQSGWDGEGAAAPVLRSLNDAGAFACALDDKHLAPQAMLHTSGLAGLYWKTDDVYADFEFLGDGRVAFYWEKHSRSGNDRVKGVVHFDGTSLPETLEPLLRA